MSRAAHYATLALLAASSSAPGQAGVQRAPCTYERCALRVEAVPGTLNASRLVQGIEARPVETAGFFMPRIQLFDASPDSVRIPYYAFRDHTAVARGAFAIGLAATVVEAISIAQHHNRPPNILPIVGLDLGLGVAGLVEAKQASDALEMAIARYNAALPDR